MLERVAAGLIAMALVASPAAAANVSGWYAGIYAGGSSVDDVEFGYDQYVAQLFGPGAIEVPSAYVNEGGLDPHFFDFLNLGPEYYAFADSGMAESLLVHGALSLLGSPTGGVVVGYGFGNGLRVEADLSAASYTGNRFDYTAITGQSADGVMGPTGVWTWTNVADHTAPAPSGTIPLEGIGFVYRTDVQFLLANAFFDIDTGTPVMPYLGAGVGAARVTGILDDLCGCVSGGSRVRLVPAAQLGAGVRIALSDPVSLDIGYRAKIAASPDLYWLDPEYIGGGGYQAFGVRQSGPIVVHTLQAGITFALQ